MATEFWVPGPDGTTAADTNVGMPGGPPGATAGMQGNPDPRDVNQVIVLQLPGPQTGPGQVLGAVPDTSAMIAQGLIPHNAQPTNLAQQPGADSLLAQISRGAMSLNQSNYGQGGSTPTNPPAAAPPSIAAGAASVPTFASPANVTGA